MHVIADVKMNMGGVKDKLSKLYSKSGSSDTQNIQFQAERSPPKLFLSSLPFAPRPAAEVRLEDGKDNSGSQIILRLMWGALPAPFPRVLALVCLLVSCVLYFTAEGNGTLMWLSGVLAFGPMILLLLQKRGEQELQHQLSQSFGGLDFKPHAH